MLVRCFPLSIWSLKIAFTALLNGEERIFIFIGISRKAEEINPNDRMYDYLSLSSSFPSCSSMPITALKYAELQGPFVAMTMALCTRLFKSRSSEMV